MMPGESSQTGPARPPARALPPRWGGISPADLPGAALRRRLLRELHDNVAQTLTLLVFSLDRLAGAQSDERHRLVGDARSQALDAIRHLRGVIGGLSRTDHGSGESLSRVGALARELAGAGVRLRFHSNVTPDALPAAVVACLLAIVQEALLNVRRHAGASEVSVVVSRTAREIRLVVSDDGNGGGCRRRAGVGLSIMRERAEEIGGTLVVARGPGQGTRIVVRAPLAR